MKYQLIANTFYIGTTNSDYKFLIDKEDFEQVRAYSWSETNGYLMAYDKELKKNIYLHQLLMRTHINRDKNLVVDHINHQRSDNRRKNLRIVTYQQNSRNCSVAKRNTSGYTGVSWNVGKNRWQATIRIDGRLIMLGMRKVVEEAVQLRKDAELIHFQ